MLSEAEEAAILFSDKSRRQLYQVYTFADLCRAFCIP